MIDPAELEDLRLATRSFVRDHVLPHEPRPGERLAFDVRKALQAEAKRAGLFIPNAPRELGGRGLDIRQWSPIFQEAGYSPIGPVALNINSPDEANIFMLEAIASPAQRVRYLVPLAHGDVRSSFAMSEPHPGAGSDPAALQTVAVKVDGGWRIDGVKRFTSGAVGAAFTIAMVRNDASPGIPEGATMLLVDFDNPGITIGEDINTIERTVDGGHSYVHFVDCFVADDAVLGEPGRGFQYAQIRLGPARLTHCMRWLGLARRSLDIALDRIEHREVFGSAIKDLGIAQAMIADSVIDIETSDAIIAKAAALVATDPKAGSAMSSVAKVHCSEAIYRVVDRATQLVGGDGMTDRLPLAQFLNEVRPFRIYDGANETHRWAIAKRASSTRSRSRDVRRDVIRSDGS